MKAKESLLSIELDVEISGAYDNEETAAHAYDLAALKYWGQDTIINFPVLSEALLLICIDD